MIQSFFYGTWICGQVLYWFFLRHQTALLREEYWRMLNIFAFRAPCKDLVVQPSAVPAEFKTPRSQLVKVQNLSFCLSSFPNGFRYLK
jgi:hypothetical protein